jgi:hypothetical protein
MAIEEWQVSRIEDVKDEINHYIKDIGRINAISLTLVKAVGLYNGKCWNKKIEKSVEEKVKSTYNFVYFSGLWDNGKFYIAPNFLGMHVPYALRRVYKADDEKLYTQAGNFRINAQEWQEQARSYSQKCADYIKKLEADKENLEDVVNKYNKLLDDAIHVAESLQSETCDSIREARLFHSPISRLF